MRPCFKFDSPGGSTLQWDWGEIAVPGTAPPVTLIKPPPQKRGFTRWRRSSICLFV